jgi:hypothetical protein
MKALRERQGKGGVGHGSVEFAVLLLWLNMMMIVMIRGEKRMRMRGA